MPLAVKNTPIVAAITPLHCSFDIFDQQRINSMRRTKRGPEKKIVYTIGDGRQKCDCENTKL